MLPRSVSIIDTTQISNTIIQLVAVKLQMLAFMCMVGV